MTKAVGVVPARIGSTRLPEKPLLAETGKPLIVHVCESAAAAKSLSEVIVATDDARIAGAAEHAGFRAVLTSRSCPTGTDRVAEVAASLDAEIIANIQGDEPEIEASTIDLVVALLRGDAEADIATAAAPIRSVEDFLSPHQVKVVVDSQGIGLWFSRAPIPFRRDGRHDITVTSALALGHLGIYGYRRKSLSRFVSLPASKLESCEQLEQLRALENGMRIKVARVENLLRGIDTREDYEAYVRRTRSRRGVS